MRSTITTAVLALAVVISWAAPAGAAPYYVTVPSATISHAPCPNPAVQDAIGCVDIPTRTIYVTARCGRFCQAHEYGHLFDAEHLDDATRGRWAAMLGESVSDWNWSSTSAVTDPPLEERFADAFALCALGRKERDRRYRIARSRDLAGGYGRLPQAVVAATCWLINRPG